MPMRMFIHTLITVVHFIRESPASKRPTIRGYQIDPTNKKWKTIVSLRLQIIVDLQTQVY